MTQWAVDAAALGVGTQRAIGRRAPQSPRSFRLDTTRDEAPAPPLLDRPDAEWAVPRPRIVAALTPCAPEEDPINGRIYSVGLCAVAGRGARLFQPHLFTSIYAETFPLERVGLWGGQQTYRTLRGSIAVGFEAGAAVRLRERVNLTAGFRLLGYGLGENGPLDGGSLDPSITAPLLGLAIKY
jgi:hypothetical protein